MVEGIPNIKSMDIDSQGLSKVDRLMYSPYFLIAGLVMEKAMHNFIYL